LSNQTPGSTTSFNTDLTNLLNSPGSTYNQFVYYSPNSATTPTLGEVRGKIVFVPAADGSWTPPAANSNGEIGWTPSEVAQNTPQEQDPNNRWNEAENSGSSGLIPTDLGSASTLYTNDLSQNDIPARGGDPDPVDDATTPIELGDDVDNIATTYFGEVKVSRTTGIVGIDDPSQNLITEIENENNLPIIVTSDSDAAGATGTLRDAILEANAEPGFNTIEFAPKLTGSTGNTIILESNLPAITNDVVIAGAVVVYLNGYQGFQNSSTHTVTETNLPATDRGLVTPQTSTFVSDPLYVDTSGVTVTSVSLPVVDPINISYGTKLNNNQLQGSEFTVTNGTIANVPGMFAFTSANGTLLPAGDYTEAVTFTPNNQTLNSSSVNVPVDVAKIMPQAQAFLGTINITYGTALASSQLAALQKPNTPNGPLAGTWVYTSAAGTVLDAGNGQSEGITFIPTDTTDYASVSSTVNLNVAQAAPMVTAVNPVNINYGQLLDNSQLSGTATYSVGGTTVNVSGTFTYQTAEGAELTAGNGQSERVTFTPADTVDYLPVRTTVTVNVTGGDTPTIVSVNPVSIPSGTALANSQLSGVATYVLDGNTLTLPGTFSYTTALGTVLSTGNNQTEAVTFTPTDTADYTTASSSVTVNVGPATPSIAITSPINITYGTALANTQIIGTASVTAAGNTVIVPGVFSFTSALGAVLSAGNGQTEAVTFTPTDTTDYAAASSTVTINVAQATPVLSPVNSSQPTPATGPLTVLNIQYGTPLTNDVPPSIPASPLIADNQLNAAVTYTVGGNPLSVPGTFTYTTAAGSVLNPGNGQVEAVTFTPTDTTDFKSVASTVTVDVAQDVPQVTLTDGSPVTTTPTGSIPSYSSVYTGSPQPASGTVTGATDATLGTPIISYYLATDTKLANPLPSAPTNVGNYLVVGTFPAPNSNYIASGDTINFAITPVAPTVTSVNPVNITYGTALASSQLSGSATVMIGGKAVSVPGTFTYTSATGTVLHPGNGQSEAVTFTPTSASYAPVATNVMVNVAKANVTSVNAVNITYGTALPSGAVSGSAASIVGGVAVSVPGTYTYKTAGGVVLSAGNGQTQTVTFTPTDTTDYNTVVTTVTVNVAAAGTSVKLVSSTSGASAYGQSVTFTATVSAAAGVPTPVGSVQFFSGTTLLATIALNSGTAAFSTSSLGAGADTITATYVPGNANYVGSSNALSQNVKVGLLLLDTTGSGSLNVSGGAKLVATGTSVIVDSSSSSAITASGSGQVSDSLTDVAGKASITGGASVSNLTTGHAVVGDPFASLATPTTTGLTTRSTSLMFIGGSTVATLQPGLYIGGISIGGAAKVTLAPGEYYLQGGGLTVAGSGSLTDLGKGVFIYNAAAKNTDQINISGAASVSLSPMTTGAYAGITIFQTRTSNAQIDVSGSGALDVTGTVYAADALVNISGAGAVDTFGNTLIADDLLLTGSGELLI
jgi:hypothetical protein